MSLLGAYEPSFNELHKENSSSIYILKNSHHEDFERSSDKAGKNALTKSKETLELVDKLNSNLEGIFPFITKESDKENIFELLGKVEASANDYQETKSLDSYERMSSLLDEVGRYIANLSVNDYERSAARQESLKETVGIGFDFNSLDDLESRIINIAETIPQESINFFNLDQMEDDTKIIGEKWQETFQKMEANPDLKLKIDTAALTDDITKLKNQINILEMLENALTEEQKFLLEQFKDLLRKAEEANEKAKAKSGSGEKTTVLVTQYITESSNALSSMLHGFAKSTRAGISSGVTGAAQLTASLLKTTKIAPTGISGAVVGGIMGIFSGIGAIWQSSIERKMDAIILEDTKFLNEFNEVKDAEIKAYQDHVKELNEQ